MPTTAATATTTPALVRLKAAIAAATLIAFFRKFIKPHLSPALSEIISPALPSLSEVVKERRKVGSFFANSLS